MTSEKWKCNGTLDCQAEITKLVILDWKTGECKDKYDVPPVYDEMKYQVSAYVKFFEEIRKEEVDEAYILVVAKDKVAYNLVRMDKEEIEGCFVQVFLPALHIYNYQKANK